MLRICPVDKTPLQFVNYFRRGYWSCPKCSGRLLYSSYLKKYLSPQKIAALEAEISYAQRSDKRTCFSCLQKMKVVPFIDGSKVYEIDVCVNCHIYWFDHGEGENVGKPEIPFSVEPPSQELGRAILDAVKERDMWGSFGLSSLAGGSRIIIICVIILCAFLIYEH